MPACALSTRSHNSLNSLIGVVLLFAFSSCVSRQVNSNIYNAKRDSALIAQALTEANKQQGIKGNHKWLSGKALQSTDGLLQAIQLIATPDTFTTTLQYNYHGKILQQNLDNTDISENSLDKVYRLPGKEPAYLFLLSKIEYKPYCGKDWLTDFKGASNLNDAKTLNLIKTINYAAVMLRLEKNGFVEVPIHAPVADDVDPDQAEAPPSENSAATDTNSFSFISDIRGGKYPKPYLSYDTIKHTLSFLNIYNINDDDMSDSIFYNVEPGVYQYKNNVFDLIKDTTYYYPSLQSLTKIVAQQNYQAGKYLIRAKAIEGYEEGYGRRIHAILTNEYRIGTQTLTESNNEETDSVNLRPSYRVQNNSSLVMLLMDDHNNYAPGMCGSGSYYDYYFWLVDDKSSKQLFSFSNSSCTNRVDFTFTQDGKETSGSFYLEKKADNDGASYFAFDSFWKDNSTYVFVTSDPEKGISRSFYLHFDLLDKKNPAKLTIGELSKSKALPN